ncbi:MAG: hydrogenase expression/formation protein HypE [Chloroflexi bacterium GWB2_49_20]|nr:MAG: hydrogenase expression/formation protein HypE [Chloroflexi bacterium GWB2_49_20]OGN80046.1 MAG: hydrogenase expression/formation protein HypE [Chloroflexi bacterium GWC2_49_37]OGN85418.1 MAG: hydrogenase expression/formation protein HypE [Chloroflexi bacterium GWD2_49_16]HCM97112.1 hydrogenase expression/formation protein HypE [Anaerolineae bacterium]
MAEKPNLIGWTCPRPLQNYPTIVLGHGSGGKMMADLIQHLFSPAFENDLLGQMNDSTTLDLTETFQSIPSNRLAFTTDSFVVSPLFFPGGNIGELAIFGTINDLAMSGAKPLFLSAGFILEEGLPMEMLGKIVNSMAVACKFGGVKIAAGDTKVVNRGHGDGLYINTSGIGVIPDGINISAKYARPGDVVLINGSVGDHGMAIMSVRSGLEFETAIKSDTAPLNGLVDSMLEVTHEIHCLRDATRGGLAAVLNELATASNVGIEFDEKAVPILPEVNAACEMLGLDPFYIANEGKFVVVMPEAKAEEVLFVMRKHPYGKDAAIIGKVVENHPGLVTARTSIGGMRVVDLPAGELLPRIC